MSGEGNRKDALPTSVVRQLRNILGEPFKIATAAVTYAEVKSLSYKYKGMIEFRDALTHVARAVNTDDEEKALRELETAFEHIRRGAVESMQEYVEAKYLKLLPRYNLSDIKCKLAGVKPPDREKIRSADKRIRELIAEARTCKPDRRWKRALELFREAEMLIDELDKELPQKEEVDYRLRMMLLTIGSLAVGFLMGAISILMVIR